MSFELARKVFSFSSSTICFLFDTENRSLSFVMRTSKFQQYLHSWIHSCHNKSHTESSLSVSHIICRSWNLSTDKKKLNLIPFDILAHNLFQTILDDLYIPFNSSTCSLKAFINIHVELKFMLYDTFWSLEIWVIESFCAYLCIWNFQENDGNPGKFYLMTLS